MEDIRLQKFSDVFIECRKKKYQSRRMMKSGMKKNGKKKCCVGSDSVFYLRKQNSWNSEFTPTIKTVLCKKHTSEYMISHADQSMCKVVYMSHKALHLSFSFLDVDKFFSKTNVARYPKQNGIICICLSSIVLVEGCFLHIFPAAETLGFLLRC